MPFRIKDLIISVVQLAPGPLVAGDCGGAQSCSGSSECTAVTGHDQVSEACLIDPGDIEEMGALLEQAVAVYQVATQRYRQAPQTVDQIATLERRLAGALAELGEERHRLEGRRS